MVLLTINGKTNRCGGVASKVSDTVPRSNVEGRRVKDEGGPHHQLSIAGGSGQQGGFRTLTPVNTSPVITEKRPNKL